MSKKFTGITSAGSAIPVYDKDAHSALQNKADVSALTAFQPVGDYYSASNPSGFLTAVPADMATTGDIADLAQSISETYQPKGDYQPSGDYLSASESANFYPMTGNPSGFLTEHQSLDGLMQTSGLEYDGDKISGYMGSAFKAGDELPSGVMVESAVEYNAVNEISGYNGSAIAQYGAEKQWLVHDDTLVHAANSAQYALGVNLSAVAQLLGVDETVLWSGDAAVSNCTLAEPITNFNTVKFLLYGREDANRTRMWFECETTNDTWNIQYADGTNYAYTQLVQLSSTNTTLSAIRYKELNYGAFNSTAVAITGATGTYPTIIKAVIGIGRKH